MISEKPIIALSGVAQLVGHVSKKRAFGTIGRLSLQHRFMRDHSGLFGLLFRLEQREPGIPAVEQDPEPRTVILEQTSVLLRVSIGHRARPPSRHANLSRTR
jgi:hypothetical protein